MDQAPPSCMTVSAHTSVSSAGDNEVMFIQHSRANGINGREGRVEGLNLSVIKSQHYEDVVKGTWRNG